MKKVFRVQENSYLSLVFSVLNLMFMNIFLETFLVFLRVCVPFVSFDIICSPKSYFFCHPNLVLHNFRFFSSYGKNNKVVVVTH